VGVPTCRALLTSLFRDAVRFGTPSEACSSPSNALIAVVHEQDTSFSPRHPGRSRRGPAARARSQHAFGRIGDLYAALASAVNWRGWLASWLERLPQLHGSCLALHRVPRVATDDTAMTVERTRLRVSGSLDRCCIDMRLVIYAHVPEECTIYTRCGVDGGKLQRLVVAAPSIGDQTQRVFERHVRVGRSLVCCLIIHDDKVQRHASA